MNNRGLPSYCIKSWFVHSLSASDDLTKTAIGNCYEHICDTEIVEIKKYCTYKFPPSLHRRCHAELNTERLWHILAFPLYLSRRHGTPYTGILLLTNLRDPREDLRTGGGIQLYSPRRDTRMAKLLEAEKSTCSLKAPSHWSCIHLHALCLSPTSLQPIQCREWCKLRIPLQSLDIQNNQT